MFLRDRRGRRWRGRLDLEAAERMRDLAGVDLLGPGQEWHAEIAGDRSLAIDCVCAVLLPQVEAAGFSDRAFGRRLRGAANPRAYLALCHAIAGFFPAPDPRADGAEEEGGEADAKPPRDPWAQAWEVAGFLGVNARHHSLRELHWMTRGRHDWNSRVLWKPASALLAMTNNLHSKTKREPKDFDPWHIARSEPAGGPRRKGIFR